MSVKYKKFYLDTEGFLPFNLNDLIPDEPVIFDIYADFNGIKIPIISKGNNISSENIDEIKVKFGETLYFKSTDKKSFDDYQKIRIAKTSNNFSEAEYKKYLLNRDDFFEISKDLLIAGIEVPFSIYTQRNLKFVLLIEASEKEPKRLEETFIKSDIPLYIKVESIDIYKDFISGLTKSIAGDKKIKIYLLRESSKIVIKELLKDPRSRNAIKNAKDLAQNMVINVAENKNAFFELLTLKEYDFYTYTHSVNVAALSIGLGRALNLNMNELEVLGIGGLLHDIGKSLISLEILNKPSKLTDQEFEIMNSHVKKGEELLITNKDIDRLTLLPLLEHHEKLSGKGYPLGLKSNEISIFGKISAIVDCYDALTTKRVYKPALTPFQALDIIKREAEQGHFDFEIFKVFVKTLGDI